MKTVRGTLLVLCGVLLSTVAFRAARLTLFIDGDNRKAYDASRGKVGRAEWTAAVTARKGTILTNDFQGVNIDVPADKVTSVGHFSVFFSQTGGYSDLAGNTAPQRHPTPSHGHALIALGIARSREQRGVAKRFVRWSG